MSRADRFFRYLMRLFPADFRGDFGDQMATTFSDQRRDVLAAGGGMRALRLWFDTIGGVLATAPREHLDMLGSDFAFALRTLSFLLWPSVMADVRSVLQRLDAELPATLQALEDMVGASLQPQRFSLLIMTVFAALALTLAALGAYGVLANAVAQQTHDIGVRVALGATRGDVMWMVFRRALMLTCIGIALGTAGALAATRAMSSLLFEVQSTDAVSFIGAAATLAGIAFVASLAPAWRATRVDPLVALRTE